MSEASHSSQREAQPKTSRADDDSSRAGSIPAPHISPENWQPQLLDSATGSDTASQADLGSGVPPQLRIDTPHHLTNSSQHVESPADASGSPTLPLQAEQIAEHLQQRSAELNRREKEYEEQQAQLDQQRRDVRVWIQQAEEAFEQRETQLRSQEVEFQERVAACQNLVSELESQDEDLKRARTELESEKAGLRAELQTELDDDRRQLQELLQAVDEREAELQGLIEQQNSEHQAKMTAAETWLETRRAQLHDEVLSEFESEKEEFATQQQVWNEARDKEQEKIAQELAIHESAFNKVEQELEQRRRELNEQLENQSREQQTQLREERVEFDQQLQAERDQFQQEKILINNRLRFQKEHLTKTQHELETQQRDWQNEQQDFLKTLNEQTERNWLRRKQLDHYRRLLSEREDSLEREQSLLNRSRQAFANESNRDRERFRQEREAWEQERTAQQAEIQRQQDQLTLHAQNLESRRERLDRLRQELEETHLNTLEMRMAVEEAWAQMSQATSEQATQSRVDEARQALTSHYQHVQDTISQQRQELVDAQTHLDKQKADLHNEQQQLTDWIAERDNKLRLWEQKLGIEAEAVENREATWRSTRDRWTDEKIEAESIIRNLLEQVTEHVAEGELPSSNDQGEDDAQANDESVDTRPHRSPNNPSPAADESLPPRSEFIDFRG